MCLGKNNENEKFYSFRNIYVKSKKEKILGIIIDNAISFHNHTKEVCKIHPKN